MTETKDAVIARIPAILAADERIRAGWLVGSLGTGRADRHSDIDLHCLITDGSAGWFAENWPAVAAELAGPLVLTQDIPGTIGGLAITPDWLHLDLILHPEGEYDPRSVPGLRPLYDRTGTVLPPNPTPKEFFGEPYFPQRDMELFLYFIGNLPVLFGRDEIVLAHNSVTGFRQILVDLMLAERGIRDRGGAKRLNPFLTAEQRDTLESLPTAPMERDQILAAISAITTEIRRRGRLLAELTGSVWPEALERAALDSVHRQLGVDF
ncbi:MAG TPA: hypothetical protein VHC49_27825 [Mycobacteriales bacterium]|nr:hypothetical protein [Mycobacteriales bacterium]